MMNFLKTIILLLLTNICFSQSRNDNWYFGSLSGMTFNAGAPTPLSNGVLATEEGSSVISDALGNLLFYSDGAKVYNKNHVQMPNGFGLFGGTLQSSAQACIIIKQPGNANIYYIFTVQENGGIEGFRYSTVDINLNAGLGDVVLKNVLINTTTTEKVAATYHCNGVDIWISAHDGSSNQFRSLLLSNAGLGAPVISAVGSSITTDPLYLEMGPGTMKFSPIGNKLVLTNTTAPNLLQLFNFNNSTGVFSNPQTIFNQPSYTATFEGQYGAEFSPNGNVLYTTDFNYLHQYDISSGIAATIIATKITLGTATTGNYGQLQLGPDGKIYSAESRNTFIGVINAPNTLGLGCNYNPNALNLDPLALGNNDVRLGLPSLLHFIPTKFIYPGGSSTSATYCQGDPSTPTPSLVSPYSTVGSYSASGGGLSINPATGALNLGLSTPNTYTVTFTATVTAGCISPFFSTYTITVTPGVALCYTKRAAKWYFGDSLGLNFLCSSPPSILSDGVSRSTPFGSDMEAGTTIADVNGNLLFYAHDTKVRNRNHAVMPNGNGMASTGSASQGYLPVPNPTNPNKYYLFHVQAGTGGLFYSEIDLLADAGNGDVIPATKNTLLLANVGEQLTAVESCVANETWIIVHDLNNLYTFKVTATGISGPIVSPSPVSMPGASGQMMVSPTGRHIALSFNNYSPCYLFTFDNESGKACYKETLSYGGYGCSFSNNGRYLYANEYFIGMYQYDVFAPNVNLSAIQIYDPWVGGTFIYGSMHLGPDCKLYTFGQGNLVGTVINNPNNPGLTCNLQTGSFPLSYSSPPQNQNFSSTNYIQSWFKDPTYVEPVIAANFTFSPTTVCLPSPITFSNSSTTIGECPPYLWNFGDAASGASNTSTLTSPSHIFSSPGTYTVTLTLKERCQTSIKTKTLTVYGVPTASIVADSTVCDFFGVSLSTNSVGTYSWTGPSASGVFTSTLQSPTNPAGLDAHDNEGWYYLTVTNAGGCSAKDSMFIDIIEVPTPNVTSSISNCLQTLTVTVGSSNGPILTWAWGPGGGNALGTTSVITLPAGYPGPQVVAFVTDSENCGAGFILSTPPLVSPTVSAISSGSITCTVLTATLTGTSAGNTITWNGGALLNATNPATVNAAGIYTVTATNTITGCSNTSTVLVSSSSTVPTPIIYTPNSWYCVGDNTTPLNSSSGNLWYSNAALTTLVGTGPNFSPPTITGISTYYVVDTLGACASAAASVTVQFTNCAAPACATNLLSNGGFETYSACPTNATQLTNAINWLGSGSYYNTICNGYYNSPSYFPFFTATNYTMGLAGGGVFPPPVGAGSAGLILGGTMFKNFVVQQVDLGCSKQYTLQFRATTPRSDTPPDNSLCVYGSNTPPPYAGCSASLTLLACLPSPASINNYWTPQTITFTPTVNYSYMVLTGQCPTATSHGGTVFLDDLFLCGTCVNPPVVTTAEISPASCIGANGAATSTVVGCSGTYAYDWQNVALLGTTVSTLSTASNLIAGTYSLTVTDGGGCSKTSSVTITSNIITPTVTATSSGSITCSVLTSTLTGTSAGNTLTWNGGALINATNPATVNVAGTYTVTSTNTVTGCSTTATVAVVASGGLPSVSVVAPLQITCSLPTITLTGSSATPSVTYQWTGGAAAATQTVNTAGNYTLTVTNTVTGCASTTVVTVTSNTTLPVITSAINTGSITCTNATSTLTGTSAGNTMLWNGGALVNAANPATVNTAGNYTVTATNASNGCTTTTVVSVTSNTTVPVITSAISSGSITCTNATSTLTGTSAGNTMLWNGGALVNATNPATVNAAGNYTLTATNAVTGCASTTVVSVTTNTTLPIITSATSSGSITCTALTSTLTGTSAGNTMVWNGGALVNAANPATVNSPGTYSVTATNTVTGCSTTTTVGVLASGGLPSVSVVAPLQITCLVPTITLIGSSTTPSVTYQWTGGAAAATQTVNTAGNYTLTVTNTVTGCASTTVVTVTSNTTVPVITSATSSGSITCTALTSTLSGTSAGNVLTWNGGALVNATNPATVNASGNYTLTVSNAANGCTTTTVVSVTSNTTLPVITSASSSGAINCGSGSSTLTAISAGNTLTWNGGALVNATNPSTVSTAGNYTVTSTTAVNGCSTSTVITVIATSPNVTAGAALVLNCSVLNGTINVTSITPGVTYAWSPAVVSGGTTNIATVNTAGTYSCVVTETATACTNTGVVTVTSNTTAPVITSAVSNSVMICGLVNNTTTLTAISAGNALVWNGGVLVNAPNPSIVSSAGIYTVTATNASNGCLSTATVAAISNTVAPIITTVVSSGSITCINNSATLTATSAGNTLVWSGTGIVSPLNPAVVNAAGTYTVMAINPSNGCTVTTTMAVTTNTTLPVITSSSATGTITCTSSSSTLTGISAGNTLTWNGGALANATNPSTVNASGTYTLTATNPSNGCVTNTTVSVNSNITLPTLTAGSPATISCITNTTQVTGSSLTAGVTYSWSGAGITAGATTSSATVNAAGVYSLTVTSSSTGCSNTTTVLVSASPSPTASVSSDVTIFSGASTTLTAGGGGTYVWNNGPTTSSQVVSPKETTNYCVTVTDGAGCTNQKCVLVTVELSCYTNDEYETPTAFTPNNDGMNDQFSLQGWDECTTSFFITIYDRWGEKIFESEDVNFNWDGSYKGKALGSAVFVYYIKADILKVGTINKKGNITLIR
jgi:gliding motility-associated-like protein